MSYNRFRTHVRARLLAAQILIDAKFVMAKMFPGGQQR